MMKKKTLILIAFSTMLYGTVLAQSREDFHFGIKAGVNRSNVYDTEGDNFQADAKSGFAGGIFFQLPLGALIGIQPEILYSERGYKGRGQSTGLPYRYNRSLGFIDVPLLLQIKPAEFFSIVAGPQYSLLVRNSTAFKTDGITIEDENTIKDQNLRRNTIALTGGFDINISYIVLSARAGWDLRKNVGSGNRFAPRFRNSWLQGMVGFRF